MKAFFSAATRLKSRIEMNGCGRQSNPQFIPIPNLKLEILCCTPLHIQNDQDPKIEIIHHNVQQFLSHTNTIIIHSIIR